jgi:ABC-2 type transport system permease protein
MSVRDTREITSEYCKEQFADQKKSSRLDVIRAKFIVKKKLRRIAGSRRLGNFWLVLDPILISIVYYFVFTVIRHKPDPESVFVGLTYIRMLQLSLRHGYINNIDYTGGIKIERVSSRSLILSEFLLGVSNVFFSCLGISILFLVIFESSLVGVIIFCILGLINYFFWYSVGSLFSPIGIRIPDTNTVVTYFGLMMFFGSPALYDLSATTGLHRELNLINPFSYCVEPARHFLLGSEDYLLLYPELGAIFFVLMIVSGAYAILRFDKIRWRMTSWS